MSDRFYERSTGRNLFQGQQFLHIFFSVFMCAGEWGSRTKGGNLRQEIVEGITCGTTVESVGLCLDRTKLQNRQLDDISQYIGSEEMHDTDHSARSGDNEVY